MNKSCFPWFLNQRRSRRWWTLWQW